MLQATITNAPAVNGHLLNVIDYAKSLPTLAQARHYTHAALAPSRIYKVLDGVDYVAVRSYFAPRMLALISE